MRKIAVLLTAAAAALMAPLAPAIAVQDQETTGVAELQALVDQMRAEMLRPGERVAGWDRGGADPDADVRARGAESHYMLTSGANGESVGILTRRPITDFAPTGWRVVDTYGSAATPLDSPQIDFQAMSARYILATRSQFTRRGDVDCTPGITNALLYERPGAAAGADDELIPLMFRIMILALEGQELCVRSDGDAMGGYAGRVFLPDGRLLPELSSGNSVMSIVAAAPIDRLVTWRSAMPLPPQAVIPPPPPSQQQ